jgi:hypothetical protein
MKEQILKIIENNSPEVATEEILQLITEANQALQLLQPDVSGQSELLRSYFKWHKEQGFVSHKDCDIDEFLSSNSH